MQRKPRTAVQAISQTEIKNAINLHNEAQELAGKSTSVTFEALQKATLCGSLLKDFRNRVGASNWNIWKDQHLGHELAGKWSDKYIKLEQLELTYDSNPRHIRTGLLQLELIPTSRATDSEETTPKEKPTPTKRVSDWALRFGGVIEGYDKADKEQYAKICLGIFNWMKRELYL
jgi:hypothetical protein